MSTPLQESRHRWPSCAVSVAIVTPSFPSPVERNVPAAGLARAGPILTIKSAKQSPSGPLALRIEAPVSAFRKPAEGDRLVHLLAGVPADVETVRPPLAPG
jgi:hypothetical protein